MKRISLFVIAILLFGMMSATASAQTETPPPRNPANTLRGQVIAIEGDTILVQNRQSEEARIITTAETRFRLGREQAELADIEPGHLVLAVGEKQDDATLEAWLVVAVTPEQLRRHTLRGEVLSVDEAAGTLTVQGLGQKEGIWTVQTNEQTRIRIRNVEDPTLADIPVGANIAAVGRKVDDGENVGLARLIVVLPDNAAGRAAGEVIALTDNGFTLQSLQRGELTILTDDSTEYRARAEQEATAADVQPGRKVLVIGQPVAGDDTTIRAKIVGIKIE